MLTRFWQACEQYAKEHFKNVWRTLQLWSWWSYNHVWRHDLVAPEIFSCSFPSPLQARRHVLGGTVFKSQSHISRKVPWEQFGMIYDERIWSSACLVFFFIIFQLTIPASLLMSILSPMQGGTSTNCIVYESRFSISLSAIYMILFHTLHEANKLLNHDVLAFGVQSRFPAAISIFSSNLPFFPLSSFFSVDLCLILFLSHRAGDIYHYCWNITAIAYACSVEFCQGENAARG